MSRDQPLKAPRHNEPKSLKTTSVVPRRFNDVASDVIVHKVPQDELQTQLLQSDNHAAADVSTEQSSGSQQRTPTTSKDHTECIVQREDSNIAQPPKDIEHSNQETNKTSDLKLGSLNANDDTAKCETNYSIVPQLTKVRRMPRESPKRPPRTKRKQKPQKTTLTEKAHDSVGREPTVTKSEVNMSQSRALASQSSITQPTPSERIKPKQAPVHTTPLSANRVNRDMFTVRVKGSGSPVKASPVKVQCKPRRQTRATLAYDRAMFFSDFFRRLESDRRLFALPPVRRNRVYVRPRAEDASTAPVKFPRPPPVTKKGRIGIVTVTRNSGVRCSPFSNKRRLPSHGLDHKIDLESIEADATSAAQPNQNQRNTVSQQLVSSALAQEQPKPSLTRIIYQEHEAPKATSTKIVHEATAVNAESAFIGVTKHSAKMRRRLKRKQRKRGVSRSEGIDGGAHDTSTSSSEDRIPSQRGDNSSRHEGKKELRPVTEHRRTTNSTTVAAVTPPRPRSSQKTQEDTDTKPSSQTNRPVTEIVHEPLKRTISDERHSPAPRGKTMVEILSRIGQQSPSNLNEASMSPKPDETGNRREEDCSVSIVVDVLDDTGQRILGGSDSKLQATTSQLTASGTRDAAMEESKKSVQSYVMRTESKLTEMPPSSPTFTSNRLSVTKTLGDGLLLRRSHSCGEMRRRMVLTEWEVVTTTNMEVTVTETGPSSQHAKKSYQNDASGNSVKSGLVLENEDQESREVHDSRRQTLGLDKNVTGHRRSKSTDNRTERHVDADTAVTDLNDVRPANDCLHSATRQNEEHPSQSDHKTPEFSSDRRHDNRKVDNVINQSPDVSDFAASSAADKTPSHQYSEESKTESTNSNLPELTIRDVSIQDYPMMTRLPLLNEHDSAPTTTRLEASTIVTYTLSQPSLVDRFTSVAETEREESWATVLNANLVIDYTVADVVENIRLRAVGNDLEPDDPQNVEEQPKMMVYEQNSVTVYSEVELPVQKSNEDEGVLCHEVEQRSHAPYQFQSQPAAYENEVTEHQQNTYSSNLEDEEVRDSDEVVHKRQETQDIPTTCEAAIPEETTRDDSSLVDQRTHLEVNVSQPRAKEDEDSEEKEADEAENRETESEETEEKGMLELNYSAPRKNGHDCEQPLRNVEHFRCENATEAPFEHTLIDDDAEELSEQSAANRDSTRVEVGNHGSLVDDNEMEPDAVRSSKSVTSSRDATELDGPHDLVPRSEGDSETLGNLQQTVDIGLCHMESNAFDNGLTLSVSELHLVGTDTCLSEPREDSSKLVVSGLDPEIPTAADPEIENETNDRRVSAETSGAKVEDEERMTPETKCIEVTDCRQDNTATHRNNSDVAEMIRTDTVSTLSNEKLNDAEPGPPITPSDHTQSVEWLPTEHSIQTSAAWTNELDNIEKKNLCVSTGTDTSYDETSKNADNFTRSPTSAHEGTPRNGKVRDSVEDYSSVGREVSNAAVEPRRRKTAVDMEIQTENFMNGDERENLGVVSESTQSSADSQTMAQHPINSCTAVNCLVCATIGKNSHSNKNPNNSQTCDSCTSVLCLAYSNSHL